MRQSRGSQQTLQLLHFDTSDVPEALSKRSTQQKATVRLRTQDSTYKIALTRFPDFGSATVIVATFALAGYRSPQGSQRKTTVRPKVAEWMRPWP